MPRSVRAWSLLLLLLVALAPAASADAATRTFGSALDHEPNVAGGCETRPMVSWSDFDTYEPAASGEATCTWWQTGVFGAPDDPRTGYVPGTGVITSVTVRSGPNPAPVRVVLARQLTAFGPNAPLSGPVCCTFAGQSDELRPAANSTTTFPLALPVEHERNLGSGIQTDDIVGISASSGAGTLPLFAVPGQTRQSAYTESGTVDATGAWPALGTRPEDGGGGRPGSGYAGFEVTARFTWCDGAGCGAGGAGDGAPAGPAGPAGPGTAPAPGAAPPAAAPRLRLRTAVPGQTLRGLRRSGALRVRCALDAAGSCRTRATLPRSAARRLGLPTSRRRTTVALGTGRVTLRAAGTATLRVPLSRRVRTALGRSRGPVRIRLTTIASAAGRTPATSVSVLRARR